MTKDSPKTVPTDIAPTRDKGTQTEHVASQEARISSIRTENSVSTTTNLGQKQESANPQEKTNPVNSSLGIQKTD